jgi:hypothetical protein
MTKTFGPVGVDFDNFDASPGRFVLNTESRGDGVGGVYVMAASLITQFDCVSIDEAGLAIPITTTSANLGHRIGVAQIGASTSNFLTVVTQGAGFLVNVIAGALADTRLYTTNTAGSLGASATTHANVIGMTIGTSNTGTATATSAIANFPHVDI